MPERTVRQLSHQVSLQESDTAVPDDATMLSRGWPHEMLVHSSDALAQCTAQRYPASCAVFHTTALQLSIFDERSRSHSALYLTPHAVEYVEETLFGGEKRLLRVSGASGPRSSRPGFMHTISLSAIVYGSASAR